MYKNKTMSLLVVSVILNLILLIVILAPAVRDQIAFLQRTENQNATSFTLNDPEIYQYISSDFSYQVRMYKSWLLEDSQDGNVAFRPESLDRFILNIFNEKTDLTPRQWYTNRFHSQKAVESDLTVNNYVTLKSEYSENGYSYIDYVVKADDTMVYFHFTLNDGTYDNSEFKVYFENVVYSIEGI